MTRCARRGLARLATAVLAACLPLAAACNKAGTATAPLPAPAPAEPAGPALFRDVTADSGIAT